MLELTFFFMTGVNMTKKDENGRPNHGQLALKPSSKMYGIYWWDDTAPSPVFINQLGKWQYVRNVSKHYERAVSKFIAYCKSNNITDYSICPKGDLVDYSTEHNGTKEANIKKFHDACFSNGFCEVMLMEMSDFVEEYCLGGYFQLKNKLSEQIGGSHTWSDNEWSLIKSDKVSHTDAKQLIKCVAYRNSFAWGAFKDIYQKGVNGKWLSDAQISFFVSICNDFPTEEFLSSKIEKYQGIRDEHLADLATQKPIRKSGFRQFVEGTILKGKVVETKYGYAVKVIIKDDNGYKVYGTCPKVVADTLDHDEDGDLILDPLTGVKVKFFAQVTRSQDDECFGFYSRPTQVEVL